MGEGIYKWYIQNIQRTHTTQHQTKETISKEKRQSSEWEKIIANGTTDKEFPKYTSSSYNSIPEKQTTQSKSEKKT